MLACNGTNGTRAHHRWPAHRAWTVAQLTVVWAGIACPWVTRYSDDNFATRPSGLPNVQFASGGAQAQLRSPRSANTKYWWLHCAAGMASTFCWQPQAPSTTPSQSSWPHRKPTCTRSEFGSGWPVIACTSILIIGELFRSGDNGASCGDPGDFVGDRVGDLLCHPSALFPRLSNGFS